ALPERTTGAAGVVPSAFRAVRRDFGGRREHRAQAILLGDLDGFSPELRGEIEEIVLDIALVFVRRRFGRMRLRRPGAFARHVARWRRALLERPYRLPGHAIQHVGIALLR